MLEIIETGRLGQGLRQLGAGRAEPLVLLHGNGSDSAAMLGLATLLRNEFHVLLPDLRGYGGSERVLIDARRGAGDWVDDLFALLDTLRIDSCHLLGWSLGGAVAMAAALREPRRVRSLLLLAPVSPFGYGGSCDLQGSPNAADYAGSGGGIVGAEYAAAVAAGPSQGNAALVRGILRHAILGRFGATDAEDDEEVCLEALYRQHCGNQAWPGDSRNSENWPGVAPGDFGPMNAISPKYFNTWPLVDLEAKPPILRIQGDSDVVISDASQFDTATLGMLGIIPGWPGLRPQPMVSQMTHMLQSYRDQGGVAEDRRLAGTGHAPHIQSPETCANLVREFIRRLKCA